MASHRIHRRLEIEELEPRIAPVGAPGIPDLRSGSDTGLYNNDDLTNLNNSAAGKVLQFDVSGTSSGYTVALFDGGTAGSLIGTAAGNNGTVTITTHGATTLDDDEHSIVALQYKTGETSGASTGLLVTIDTTPPSASGMSLYLTADPSNDTGINDLDLITSDTTPGFDVYGGVDYWRLYRDATPVSGLTSQPGDDGGVYNPASQVNETLSAQPTG